MTTIKTQDDKVVISTRDRYMDMVDFEVINWLLSSVIDGNLVSFATSKRNECEVFCQCNADCEDDCDNSIYINRNSIHLNVSEGVSLHHKELGITQAQIDTLFFCSDVCDAINDVLSALGLDMQSVKVGISDNVPTFAFELSGKEFSLSLHGSDSIMAHVMRAISGKLLEEANEPA